MTTHDLSTQFGPQTQQRLRGKFLCIKTGVELGRLCHLSHLCHRGPAQAAWLRQFAPVALCGGLRRGTTLVEACVKRRRATSRRCSIPVNTVASSRRALPG